MENKQCVQCSLLLEDEHHGVPSTSFYMYSLHHPEFSLGQDITTCISFCFVKNNQMHKFGIDNLHVFSMFWVVFHIFIPLKSPLYSDFIGALYWHNFQLKCSCKGGFIIKVFYGGHGSFVVWFINSNEADSICLVCLSLQCTCTCIEQRRVGSWLTSELLVHSLLTVWFQQILSLIFSLRLVSQFCKYYPKKLQLFQSRKLSNLFFLWR